MNGLALPCREAFRQHQIHILQEYKEGVSAFETGVSS